MTHALRVLLARLAIRRRRRRRERIVDVGAYGRWRLDGGRWHLLPPAAERSERFSIIEWARDRGWM